MAEILMQAIKQAALDAVMQKAPTTITYGTILAEKPLEILVEDKFKVSAPMLLLCSGVIDRETEISFDNPGIENIVHGYLAIDPRHMVDKLHFMEKIKNEITIYDGLKTGEKVMLLRVQGGQKYIVLDRLVTAT